MHNQKRQAVTMSEILVTLGLIGVLAVTMLSLNSFSDNSYQIATTKMMQVDSSLKSWGKAISKSNETGLGAAATITTQDELVESLTDYFNVDSSKGNVQNVKLTTSEHFADDNADDDVDTSTGYTNATKITLDNGVEITAAMVDTDGKSDAYGDTIAVVTASAPYGKSEEATMSEEYIVTPDGVSSLSSQYEGWDKEEVVVANDKYYACAKGQSIKDGNCRVLDDPTTCKYIYTDSENKIVTSCGIGQTGTIITSTVGDCQGTKTDTKNTCCVAPTTKASHGLPCTCPTTFVADQGNVPTYEPDKHCQITCKAGTYAEKESEESKITTCKLCPSGSYCPEDGMTTHTTCPAGSYCPEQKTDDTQKFLSEEIKYIHISDIDERTNEHKEVIIQKGSAAGGLIEAVECSKGTYQPNSGATECLACPAGSKCPNKGMAEAIKCPAGTYSQGGATECTPCPANKYCPEIGTETPKGCPDGTWSDAGAVACVGCSAGSYYYHDEKTQKRTCIKCLAGTYQPNSGATKCEVCPAGNKCPNQGMTAPIPCECGTYQANEGQTICNGVVGAGSYAVVTKKDKNDKDVTTFTSSAATGALGCELGYACAGKCQDRVKCKAGYYPAKVKKEIKNNKGEIIGYEYEYANKNATVCAECEAGYYCPDGNVRNACELGYKCPTKRLTAHEACPCGQYQDKTAQTACKAIEKGYFGTRNDIKNSKGQLLDTTNMTFARSAAAYQAVCPKGHYCPGACSNKIQCECDTYADVTGLATCKTVLPGDYASMAGNDIAYVDRGANTVRKCLKGHYCPGYKKGECRNHPTQCPCDTYADDTGFAECEKVPAGKYASMKNDKTGAYVRVGADIARVCIAGHACPGYKVNQCQNHPQLCAAGHYTANANGTYVATGAVQCKICSAGYYCIGHSQPPKACDKGHKCPTAGMANPTACPTCEYQNQTGQKSCKAVSTGYYANYSGNYIAATSQSVCPKGSFCEGSVAKCMKQSCHPGSYAPNTGMTQCKAVECGYYQDQTGASTQKCLPAGRYNTGAGQSSLDTSFACDSNSATAAFLCPANACTCDLQECPNWGTMYMVIDGHGYNKTLNSLLDTFTCINKLDLGSGQLQLSGGSKLFLLSKSNKTGKFSLIKADTVTGYGINHLRVYGGEIFAVNQTYNPDEQFIYDRSGASNYSVCNAHYSSSVGGMLHYYRKGHKPCSYNVAALMKRVSPLILDFEGNGMKLTTLNDGVNFDLNMDDSGDKEKTAWTDVQYTFDDAFLCYDRNQNGLIDNGGELFGDQYGAENGFEELAKFDSNGDGKISDADIMPDKVMITGDEVFTVASSDVGKKVVDVLKLWVDYNKNGVVDYISAEDYELLVAQAVNTDKVLEVNLKHNMTCDDSGCTYQVRERGECKKHQINQEKFDACMAEAQANAATDAPNDNATENENPVNDGNNGREGRGDGGPESGDNGGHDGHGNGNGGPGHGDNGGHDGHGNGNGGPGHDNNGRHEGRGDDDFRRECENIAKECVKYEYKGPAREVETVSADSQGAQTLELRSIAELNVESLSVGYVEKRDKDGNLITDAFENVVGMVGSFVQKVWNAVTEAWDYVTKVMTDVWFVTDNKDLDKQPDRDADGKGGKDGKNH